MVDLALAVSLMLGTFSLTKFCISEDQHGRNQSFITRWKGKLGVCMVRCVHSVCMVRCVHMVGVWLGVYIW